MRTGGHTGAVPPATRTWTPGRPVDVRAVLSALRRGPADPAMRLADDGTTWRATRTPDGPALLHLRPRPTSGDVEATAWGPGAHWTLDGVPELLGEADTTAAEFRPRPEHRRLVEAWRRRPGWRVPRSRAVTETLVAAALEQVVTGQEARRAWRRLLHRYGEPAPGPTGPGEAAEGMRVPPAPADWLAVPSWDWLQAGVEERRRRVVRTAAGRAGALERTLTLDHADAERALRSLPGVGVWTAAEVRHRAHGDPDAFSFADYHVSRDVSWALTGEVLDDAGCAEVIACYAGHRYRVQRLLELAGERRPRRGPRMTLPTHLPGHRPSRPLSEPPGRPAVRRGAR